MTSLLVIEVVCEVRLFPICLFGYGSRSFFHLQEGYFSKMRSIKPSLYTKRDALPTIPVDTTEDQTEIKGK